jgi:glutamate:GABA antiporter
MATLGQKMGKEGALEQDELSAREFGSLNSEEYVVKAMPAILGKFDMTVIYLMIIFYITNSTVAVSAGAAAFTYLALGGVAFFIPCVIATAQLGMMFPYEGSLYNWTHKAFGGYWSFFVAFCAWFPGVLVMIIDGDAMVAYIQGLNAHWLIEPWQQGLVVIAVVTFSGVIAIQRFRMVQNAINMAAVLLFVAVLLLALAVIVWLAKGQAVATSFNHSSDWSINWTGSAANISLFGLVTLAYLGIETPLNMGGELAKSEPAERGKRKIITGHLFWGTLLVFIGYFVATLALLVVEGSSKGATPFALVNTVIASLGQIPGDIAAVCIMSFFVLSAVTYNYAYARLLLVAGIDQRLPASVGKLNKNRVPSNAIIFQTSVAIVVASIMFVLVPYIVHLSSPINLSTEMYNIILAASTLVWAISTLFLFLNLMRFFTRDPQTFNRQRIFPMPVLFISVALGSISCILAVVGTLFFSWIPGLISNGQWWYIVGGLTGICLAVAAIGSMLGSSEAAWEGLNLER